MEIINFQSAIYLPPFLSLSCVLSLVIHFAISTTVSRVWRLFSHRLCAETSSDFTLAWFSSHLAPYIVTCSTSDSFIKFRSSIESTLSGNLIVFVHIVQPDTFKVRREADWFLIKYHKMQRAKRLFINISRGEKRENAMKLHANGIIIRFLPWIIFFFYTFVLSFFVRSFRLFIKNCIEMHIFVIKTVFHWRKW